MVIARHADPDAAWAFVRTLLLPEYQAQASQGFSVRQDVLAADAAAAQRPDPDGDLLYEIPAFLLPQFLASQGQLPPEQEAYWRSGVQAADCQRALRLIYDTHTLYQYDTTIADLLWEEAAYFYDGVRSAEDAAAILQDRVQTYLSEQA